MSWKTNASEPESPTMQSSMIFDPPELESLSENSLLQLRWDRAMCKQLGLPIGYGKVSVLLVKWNEEEDEFKKTGEEVCISFPFVQGPCQQNRNTPIFTRSEKPSLDGLVAVANVNLRWSS
jgi:hypothetical protein